MVDIEREVEQAATYWASAQERASDDIGLTILVFTARGERMVIGFPGMTDELRPVLGKVVRHMVGERIDAYIAVMTGWTSTRLDVRPADDPEHGEVLIVQGATRGGGKAHRAYAMARFGDEIRLRLMDWTQMEALTFAQILEEELE